MNRRWHREENGKASMCGEVCILFLLFIVLFIVIILLHEFDDTKSVHIVKLDISKRETSVAESNKFGLAGR